MHDIPKLKKLALETFYHWKNYYYFLETCNLDIPAVRRCLKADVPTAFCSELDEDELTNMSSTEIAKYCIDIDNKDRNKARKKIKDTVKAYKKYIKDHPEISEIADMPDFNWSVIND